MTTRTKPAKAAPAKSKGKARLKAPPETYREFSIPKPPNTEISGGGLGDPVGALEISERLGIQDRSIHMVRRRGQLPKPDYIVNGSRAWEWSTILWWAGETDRLRSYDLLAAYRDAFGVEPCINPGNRQAPGTLVREDLRADLPVVPSMP